MTRFHLPFLALAGALALAAPAFAAPQEMAHADQDRGRADYAAPSDKARLDNDGANFLKTAIEGDNSEIMLGRMAMQNPTTSPAVKRFSRMLIEDHTQVWMSAWWLILDHPYFAVTDERGAFAIPDVPAGPQQVLLHNRAIVANAGQAFSAARVAELIIGEPHVE